VAGILARLLRGVFQRSRRDRLEVMNYLKRRKLVRRLWNELEGFTNPLDRLMRRHAGCAR